MAEIDLFFWWIKPKKWINSKKYSFFGQAGKVSVQLNKEYKHVEKSEKFMIIFAKICTEKGKLS